MAILQVRVKPNSKQASITEEEDGSLTVQLQSPPVEGKANRELISILSKHLGIPKSQIAIKSGLSSKNKLIEFPD
ncbi:MAG TPA: DUF167 domain-containing protein [Oscillatoriales cyanobacterium M59_W2019_021]|nr:DUF167 domain-containing protein [Oscillatoriales cyanobacterium M4454_W2019_049]HIK52313.1 DUF167 domain-containing protein [Oscillatoriales cyanobacterium M59_W2019_021]